MTKRKFNAVNDETEHRICGSSRFSLALVTFFGCISMYLMRINMSVAVVCMTRDSIQNSTFSTNASDTGWFTGSDRTECMELVEEADTQGEFEWDRTVRGMVNSSYFVGLLTQIIGGWLAARYGGKWVLAVGMLVTIAASLLSPIAARSSVYLLMAMRVIKGMGSGVLFPTTNQMWAHWAPFYERSFLLAFVFSGNSWGSILSFFLSGVICDAIGWDFIFYIYAIFGCFWFVFWVFFAYSTPSDHPRISKEELEYIGNSIEAKPQENEKLSTPWLAIFGSRYVWANAVADFCHAWGGYTALTSITQYMKDVLKFDIKQNGLYNSFPYVCQWIGTIVFSIAIDYIRSKHILSTTSARKLGGAIACFLPGSLLVAVSFLDCHNAPSAVAIICLVELFASANRVSIIPNKIDLAPRYAGVIMGIGNSAATIAGIIDPIITGKLTPNGSESEWQRVFITSACMYVSGGLVFVFLSSAEVQPWARKPEDEVQNTVTSTCRPMLMTRMEETKGLSLQESTEDLL